MQELYWEKTITLKGLTTKTKKKQRLLDINVKKLEYYRRNRRKNQSMIFLKCLLVDIHEEKARVLNEYFVKKGLTSFSFITETSISC